MNLEKTKTLQNLINACAGESLARNRYTFFSKIAQKEGYEEIGQVFLETAENEKEHAKLFYQLIPEGKDILVSGKYPFSFGNTYENLIAATDGEKEEWEILYNNASLIAKDEGFESISKLFLNISEIEKRHAHRFMTLAELIKKEEIFKKEEVTQWICRKCGHTHIGKEAPCICPVCSHPQGYFQVFSEMF